MKRFVFAAALLFSTVPAFADFEGVLHMKMTLSKGGAGTAKTYLSKNGTRQESEMNAGGMNIKTTTLSLKSEPKTLYVLNDAEKTYSEIDLQAAEKAATKTGGTYTAKLLGEETVAGYKCRRVLVTHPTAGESELWTTREIAGYEDFVKMASEKGRDEAGFMKALKSVGADGFPVKSIHRGAKAGGEMTVEIVKTEKKSLPASLFQLPANYKKSESAWTSPAGAGSPDAQKAMQESLKQMTPQQREMLEKMMKKREPR